MSTTQTRSSRVKWVNNVKNETHQLLGEFGQEGKERIQKGKERISAVQRNASAVKLFLNESGKDRLAAHKETMGSIKSKIQYIRQEGQAIIKDAHDFIKDARDLIRRIAGENKELAGDVKQFLTQSETARRSDYETVMKGVHQSIRELRERTKEIRRESVELLKQLGGENGTLRTEMKEFLNESESTRKRDYSKMMNEVRAVVDEIQAYEREERRLAGAREVHGDVVKKKEIIHEAKPEVKAATEGKSKVEEERKKLMLSCEKCGTRHWPFQKCPQEKSSFKKNDLKK